MIFHPSVGGYSRPQMITQHPSTKKCLVGYHSNPFLAKHLQLIFTAESTFDINILLQALKTRSTRIQKSCLTNLHLNTHIYIYINTHMYMPIYIHTCVYIYIYTISLSLCNKHTILSVSVCSIYAVAEHFNPNRFCQVCLAPSFPTRSPASAPDIVAALRWGSWLHPT